MQRRPQPTFPDYVICFDRDLTIDVNPPKFGGAVPLSWVKDLAHSPLYAHIDVWATGNQHLRKEAEIPGIEEARQLFEDMRFEDAEVVYEDEGYHSYKPSRQDGLRMIYDVYEAAVYESVSDVSSYTETRESMPKFIVVDDADLRGLSNFVHYFPSKFVDAVNQGWTLFDYIPSEGCNESAESNACQCDLTRHCAIAMFDD